MTSTELLPGADGVVAEREALTLVDSRSMPWQDWDGMPGSRIKTFVRGSAGEPLVYLTWSPPRLGGGGEPHRHYHRTVREYHYVLDGEVPIWEYDSADQQHGDFLLFRAGYYMDRQPGSLHGIEPVPTTPVARTMLCWRERSGTYLGEADFHEETEVVPYRPGWRPVVARETPPDRADGLVRDRGGLTLLDSRAMPWEPFHGIPGGGAQKVLARDARGEPSVFLTWSPPGAIPGLELPHRHHHRTVTENVFVLAGEFPHWEYPDPEGPGELAVFRAGWFMQRRPGPAGVHGLEPGPVSSSGRLLLCWRDGTGNYVGDADYGEETVIVA